MTNQDKELSGEPTLQQVVAFLLGEGVLDGMGFGDSDTANPKPRYWWRKHLRAAFATSPQLPVAEQPAGQAVPVAWLYESESRGVDLVRKPFSDAALALCPPDMKVTPLYAAPHSPVAQMSGDLQKAIEIVRNYFEGEEEEHDIEKLVGLLQAASHPSNAAVQDAPVDAWPVRPWPNLGMRSAAYASAVEWSPGDASRRQSFMAGAQWMSQFVEALEESNKQTIRAAEEHIASLAPVPQVVQAPSAWLSEQWTPPSLAGESNWITVATTSNPTGWDGFRNVLPLYSAPQPAAAPIVPSDEQAKQLSKEARRDLSHIENFLEKANAPETIRNRSIDVRSAIIELAALTTASNAGEAKQGADK